MFLFVSYLNLINLLFPVINASFQILDKLSSLQSILIIFYKKQNEIIKW